MQEHPVSVSDAGVGSVSTVAAPGICVRGPTLAPRATFVVAIEWLASGVPVVSVTGELDLTTASTLEATLLTLPDHRAEAVVVDLSQCEFMDLRGLRVLLAARERLERSNRPLVLVSDDPNLLMTLKLTRVDALFEIYPSLAAAADWGDDGYLAARASEKQVRSRERNESTSRSPTRAPADGGVDPLRCACTEVSPS